MIKVILSSFLQRIELPYDPVIPLLGIYPEENMVWKDTYSPMFTAELFAIVKAQKQPKCLSKEEWVKKMLYIYTMEYCSSIRRDEAGSFVEIWMDL